MVIYYGPKRLLSRSARRSWAMLAVLGALAAPAVQAATFGHARLASAAGQPLVIVVPVTNLSAADLQALSARPAPAAAWAQAGLTPPVTLTTLTVSVTPGVGGHAGRALRIQSPEPFSGALADVLLDVRTATGSERYQVSLIGPGLAQGSASAPARAASQGASSAKGSAVGSAPKATSVRRVPGGTIRVRTGDTMLAIAHRHAVDGVSVYQLMLALQRANPQAFIDKNINLVRAGSALAVPSVADMLSISDAEARRQFVAQTAAFDRLRGREAGAAQAVRAGQASAGTVSESSGRERIAPRPAAQDRVRLSEGRKDRADTRAARGHAMKDAESRVGQLQDNVQNLNQALQAQGEAASHAVADGANAIGTSIQKIAGAISQASHEAAAQAADRAASESSSAPGANGAGTNGAGAGASLPGAAPGETIGGIPSGGANSGSSASGAAPATDVKAAGSMSAGTASAAAAGGKSAPGASVDHDSLFGAAGGTPASEAQAHANAEAAELHASEQTQHRVNWLQDHLLGVMTALLALIVFIIAWLLRRANAARDESDAEPRVTEAMVQEKLQGVDLELPPREPGAPSSDA
ncbi:hypothetical protein CDEF62S_05895 [Castellaniella defragrans]